MLSGERKDVIRREKEETPHIWPENYYSETDPAKRKAFLEEALKETGGEETEQRKKLFELRYSQDKKGVYADNFLRVWMELKMLTANLGSPLGAKKNKKRALAALHELCLDRSEEFSGEILYQEMCHLTARYILACADDTNYGSFIWGFGKISDEKLRKKIRLDLEQIGEGIPFALGLEEEFRILNKAVLTVKEQYL